jgi:hypothetical protein
MAITVGSRPSHYEVLGLMPTATDEEIREAFARKMSVFQARPLGAIAEYSAAYETLRNPAKRRAYDETLGLTPKPKRQEQHWGFAVTQERWAPFIGAGANILGEAAGGIARATEPHVTPEPTLAEPKVAAIAASLREVARPAEPDATPRPTPAPRPDPAPTPVPRADPVHRPEKVELSLDLQAEHIRIDRRPQVHRWSDAEEERPEWNRTGLLIGGLLLGVGLIGGVAGVAAGGDVQDSVTVAVPAAKPSGATAVPAAPAIAASAEQPMHEEAAAPAPSRRTRPAAQPGFAQKELVALNEPSATDPLAPVDGVSEQPVAQAVPASLPLSNAVIARTIERIGYSCGEVASATAGESRGVFRVTCSSGQTYQASPVRGRYRFRRVSGR